MIVVRTNERFYLVELKYMDLEQQMIVRAPGGNPKDVNTHETMSKYGMYVFFYFPLRTDSTQPPRRRINIHNGNESTVAI